MKKSKPATEQNKNLLGVIARGSQHEGEITIGHLNKDDFVRAKLIHYIKDGNKLSIDARDAVREVISAIDKNSLTSCEIMVWGGLIIVLEHASGACFPICFTNYVKEEASVYNAEEAEDKENRRTFVQGTTRSKAVNENSSHGSKSDVVKNQSGESRVRLSESWVDGPTILKGDTVIWSVENGKEVRGIADPYKIDQRGEIVTRNDGTIKISYKGGSMIAKRTDCFLVTASKDSDGLSNRGGDGSKTISPNSRSSSARSGFDPPSGPSQPGHESFESAQGRGAYTGDRQSWDGYAQAAAVAERDCK